MAEAEAPVNPLEGSAPETKPLVPAAVPEGNGTAPGHEVGETLKRKLDEEEGHDVNGTAKKQATEGADGTHAVAANPGTVQAEENPEVELAAAAEAAGGSPGKGGFTLDPSRATPSSNPGGITAMEPKEGQIKAVLDVPQAMVGRIIGRGGETIRDLQARSGCEIQIDQNFPEGSPRQLHIMGNPEAVEQAKKMVDTVMESGPQGLQQFPVLATDNTTVTVECLPHLVGRLIGKGGETIRELQARSRSRIQIDQSMAEGEPRRVIIMGEPTAVQLGEAMVRAVMENGPAGMNQVQASHMFGAAPSAIPGQDPTNPYTVDCPKNLVGRVIGRGGETIQALQQKTGCRIQIDQNVPDGMPCKITVVNGPPHAMAIAAQLVYDVMSNGPQRLYAMQPMTAPAPGYGGGYGQAPPQQQPYGGGYAQPQPQYGAPYGAPAPAPAPYYAQGGYGQQAAGGYGQQQGAYPPQQGQYGAAPQQAAPSHYGQPASGSQAPPAQQQYGAYGAKPAASPQPAAQAYPYAQQPQQQQPAPQAAPSGEWQECKTAEGVPYWYNSVTGVSQWTKP